MCLGVFVLLDFFGSEYNWASLVLSQEVTLPSAHGAEIMTPRDALILKLFTSRQEVHPVFPLIVYIQLFLRLNCTYCCSFHINGSIIELAS